LGEWLAFNKQVALVFLFLFSLGQLAWAVEAVPASQGEVRSGAMKIFAVTGDGEGLSADLYLELVPGTGKVWTSVNPLVGTTTQSAEKAAVQAAKKYSPEWEKFDYKFSIGSTAAVVEGPSAGAAMAYMVAALLQGKTVPRDVSITGTISEDGIVGTVGGVFEKARAAKDGGMKLFMIPSGEARRIEKLESGVESINLIQYAKDKWGLYVVEASTLDDVLKYAYTDVSQIDIKELAEKEPPEFVPKPTTPAEELLPMKEITRKHLKETKQLMKEARNALSSTLIEDVSIIGRMVASLNNAEKNLKTADILLDQGYLYSSANFAFLARVNAMLIKDIAENPSLLSDDSTVFDLKVDLLKQELVDLKKQLSEFMPVDRLEWMVSAQQRLGWAETTLNELSRGQTIVVSAGGSADKKEAVIDALYKFESARAWLLVAREFFEAAKVSQKKVKPLPDFVERVQDLLVKAENGLTVFKGEDIEDIERRIASAREELKRGWSLSALFNAASAQALIEGKRLAKEDDAVKLEASLRKKLADLGSAIANSKYRHVWANLYLDHARYYLEEAVYYKELNHKSDALSSLKNGLSLAMLAESLFKTVEEVSEFYEKNAAKPYTGSESAVDEVVKTDQTKWYLMFFLLPTVLFIVLLVLLLKILKARKSDVKYSVYEEIKGVKQKQREIEERLSRGRLSQDEYLSESGRLSEQLRRLLRMREAKTEESFASDKLRADLLLFDMKSRDLRRSLKQRSISPEDFRKLTNEYNAKVKQLYEALAEEESIDQVVAADQARQAVGRVESDWSEVQRSVRKQVKPLPKKKPEPKK